MLRVLENRVLRKTFGPKRRKVTRGWRRSHTEELHDWHSLTTYILVNKSRGMGLAGHAACRGEEERWTQGFGGEI
jgi:hypothetical protein